MVLVLLYITNSYTKFFLNVLFIINMEEYKGIFYNDNSEKKYYEGGAHFRYKDLVRELTFIKKQRESHTTSLSSLSTNDIKTQSPLKKSLIIHKLPNRKENSQERNVEQSSTRRVIYKNNQTNSINSYREKMPLINNNINSRNMTKQKKVSLNQIKTMNIEYNYFAHISNNSHIRNNSKEQIFFLKSSSLKSLVPIVNKNQRKNIVNQKSFLFNGFNQQLRSRNVNCVRKSNSMVKTGVFSCNQINSYNNNPFFNKTLLNVKRQYYH